jgi:hypothetical protein
VLFAALMVDRGGSVSPSMRSSHGVQIDASSGVAMQITHSSIDVRVREV